MARKSANHCSTETSSGGRDKIATFILPIKRKSLKRSSWPTQTQLPLHGGKNYFPKKLIWSNEEGVVTHFRPNMVILLRPPPAAERVYCRSLVPILASLVPNLASLVAYATRDARFGTRDLQYTRSAAGVGRSNITIFGRKWVTTPSSLLHINFYITVALRENDGFDVISKGEADDDFESEEVSEESEGIHLGQHGKVKNHTL